MLTSVQGNTKGQRRLCAERAYAPGEVILEERSRFWAPIDRLTSENDTLDAVAERAQYELTLQVFLAVHGGAWDRNEMYADSFGDTEFSEAIASATFPGLGTRGGDFALADFQKCFRLVATNHLYTFTEDADGRKTTGYGFFETLSFANHACYHANCALAPGEDNALKLMAQAHIKKGDELKIPYTIFEPRTPCHIRRSYLKEMFGFDCTCATCKAEVETNADLMRKLMPKARLCSISDTHDGPHCANCGSMDDLRRCSRCLQVWYCSRGCQVHHWKHSLLGPNHKDACKSMK